MKTGHQRADNDGARQMDWGRLGEIVEVAI
jgi:hypothetical protein